MKNIKKRILSLILILAMMVGLMPAVSLTAYAADHPIQIGANYYDTWSAAVAAATEGCTITLHDDVIMDTGAMPSVKCTINGSTDGGATRHTLTFANQKTYINKDMTIKDIMLKNEGYGTSSLYLTNSEGATHYTLTIEGNVTMSESFGINGVNASSGHGSLIVNGNLQCFFVINITDLVIHKNGSLTVTGNIHVYKNATVDGIVTAPNGFGMWEGILSGSGTIVFTKANSDGNLKSTVSLSVENDCTITLKADGFTPTTSDVIVCISNSTNAAAGIGNLQLAGSYANYTLKGMAGDSDYIYKLENSNMSAATVTNGETTINCKTWAAAVAAVETGGTITLFSDVTMGISDVMPTVECTINGSPDGGITRYTLMLPNDNTYLGADTTIKDIVLKNDMGGNIHLTNSDGSAQYILTVEGNVTMDKFDIVTLDISSGSTILKINGNLQCSSVTNITDLVIHKNGNLTVTDDIYVMGKATVDGVVTAPNGFEMWGGILSGLGTIVFTKANSSGNLFSYELLSVASDCTITLRADGFTPTTSDVIVRCQTKPIAGIGKLQLAGNFAGYILKDKAGSSNYDYTLAASVNKVIASVSASPTYGSDITVTAAIQDSSGNALAYDGIVEFYLDDSVTPIATSNAHTNGVFTSTLSGVSGGEHKVTAKYISADLAPEQRVTSAEVIFTVTKEGGLTGTPQNINVMTETSAKNYTFDLSTISLNKTDVGNITYSAVSSDTTILSSAPTINGNVLKIPVKENVTSGATATITVTVKTDNYSDATAVVTLTAVHRTNLTVSGVSIGNKVYDGNAVIPIGTPVFSNGTKPIAIENPVYLYEGTGSTIYSSSTAPKDVGTYTLTVSVPLDNKTYKGNTVIPFTITSNSNNSGGGGGSSKNSSSGSSKDKAATDKTTIDANKKDIDTTNVSGKTSFTDISNHWAKKEIEFVTAKEYFSGTSKDKFSPNISMTRGMFVTVLGRLAKADINSYKESGFADVKADAYYMPYIQWAGEKGIVNGVSKAGFAPNQSITREQMAVIMASYAKAIGFELQQVNKENNFVDNAEISSYATEAVKQMQMAGVLAGKDGNRFDPKGTATRAEVSAVLKRFAELVEKK